MSEIVRRLCLSVLACATVAALAALPGPAAEAARKPVTRPAMTRGVNLSEWFQADTLAGVNGCAYGPQTFLDIRSLGADTVRLPINLQAFTSGAPDYTVAPALFGMLDQAVSWAAAAGVTLILDNHTAPTTPDRADEAVLVRLWSQLATHYRGSSASLVYEILNEPSHATDADDGITNDAAGVQAWSTRQGAVIRAIRAIDAETPILVGGVDWNGIGGEPWRAFPAGLAALPTYNEKNIVYGFHFYEPMLFSHQGARWAEAKPGVTMADVSGIPFPYDAARMPPMPAEYAGTWIEDAWRSYPTEGSAAFLARRLQVVADFAAQRGVKVLAGEFGSLMDVAPAADRAAYYQTVRDAFAARGIPWVQWDYHHGFGIDRPGSAGYFDQDLDLPILGALGWTAPQAAVRVLFDDCPGWRVDDHSSATHTFTDTGAHTGKRAIRMSRPARWTGIGLGLRDGADLRDKVAQGHALDLWLRSTEPGARLQVRFEDTDTGADDAAWRRGVDVTLPAQANTWLHVQVPLAQLAPLGGWDADTSTFTDVTGQAGRFDWGRVGDLRIQAEDVAYTADDFWIDDVRLVRP